MTLSHSKPLSLLVAGLLASVLSTAGCCKREPNDGDGGTGGCGDLCSVTGIPQASNLDFGNVPVGQAVTLKLTLFNAGTAPLNLTAKPTATITGANAADFRLGVALPPTVQVDGQAITTVIFTPSIAGTETAAVHIETDGTPLTLDVQLTGVGIQVEICAHPTTLDFGNVQVLGTPATQTINIGNCGASPVTITFPGIEGPQATDFGETGQQNTTLQPNQSLNIVVSYSPAALGPSTADLPYGVCTGCPNQEINLTGVGVDGQLTWSPSPVNFGSPPAGTTPTAIVTGTNTGTEAMTITSIGTFNGNNVFTLSGLTVAGAAVALPLAPTAAFSLAPLASFSLTVTYNTTGNTMGDSDQLLGVFTVADPAVAPRTQPDQLSGNQTLGPCSLAIAPTSVNFGQVPAMQSNTRQVTLTNSGDTACNVTAIALSASSDPYFALGTGQATSLTVAPGSSQQIAVTFSPTASNAPFVRTGQLTFQTGDTTNPSATVPLTATIAGQSVYSGGWPKWHLDNFNSGQSSADTSGLQGNVEWKVLIGAPGFNTFINSPVITTVTGLSPAPTYAIYQMGMAGVVHAYDNTGKALWTQALSSPSGDPHPSTPAVLADGSMFVATGSDGSAPYLYYLSNVGAVTFSEGGGGNTTFEDGFDSCPALGQDGTLFLADDDGASSSCNGIASGGDPYSSLAFTASAGSVTQVAGLALPLTAESERFGVAVAADDTSYWGNNGQFFAVSPPKSGFGLVPAWPACGVTLAKQNVSAISDLALDAVTNNNLYAYSAWNSGSSVQGNVAALDPATGAQKWIFNLPAATVTNAALNLASVAGNAAPAVGLDGTVYVGNGDGLYAINGATGAKIWQFSTADVTSSPAIGNDGTVFFGCADGNFYAVWGTTSATSGTLRFKITTGGPISSSPAIAPDGDVFFISDDGNLYAID